MCSCISQMGTYISLDAHTQTHTMLCAGPIMANGITSTWGSMSDTNKCVHVQYLGARDHAIPTPNRYYVGERRVRQQRCRQRTTRHRHTFSIFRGCDPTHLQPDRTFRWFTLYTNNRTHTRIQTRAHAANACGKSCAIVAKRLIDDDTRDDDDDGVDDPALVGLAFAVRVPAVPIFPDSWLPILCASACTQRAYAAASSHTLTKKMHRASRKTALKPLLCSTLLRTLTGFPVSSSGFNML